MQYTRFRFPDADALRAAAGCAQIPWTDAPAALLKQPLTVGAHTLPNRIAIHPMEGCDGTPEGAPGELTLRRYRRFAEGGAGLLWVEAVAVRRDARANPRQLWIHPGTADAFARLFAGIREDAMRRRGHTPLIIVQLTHSGRYSKPDGVPAPLVTRRNPLFEQTGPGTGGGEPHVLSDGELRALEADFAAATRLIMAAGADGVDVKCCHGYLLAESLSAYTRPGDYGGADYENRTRLYLNCLRAAKSALPAGGVLTSRLSFYDGFPHPYGFGALPGGSVSPDPAEPLRLIAQLHDELGVELLNITAGNPYVNATVNRPADVEVNLRTEPPLAGVARLLDAAAQAQRHRPGMKIVATGLSYLRHYAPNVAEALLAEGGASIAGFGRAAFAYPDLAADICETGGMRPAQACLACGKCSLLMRAGGTPGCIVRDAEVYAPLYIEVKQ